MITKYNVYYYNTIDEKFNKLKETYSYIANINLININSLNNTKLRQINDILKTYDSTMPIYEMETDYFNEIAAIGDNAYRLLEIDLEYEASKNKDRMSYLEEVN